MEEDDKVNAKTAKEEKRTLLDVTDQDENYRFRLTKDLLTENPLDHHLQLAETLINMATESRDHSKPTEQSDSRNASEQKTVTFFSSSHNASSDDLLHCYECSRYYVGVCPEHGVMSVIKDKPIAESGNNKLPAYQTTPPQLTLVSPNDPDSRTGVWARVAIPNRTVFGPYKGRKTSPDNASAYSWLIRKVNEADYCVDAGDTRFSNWMRFVKYARTDSERNLYAFQFKGNVFYRTTRHVNAKEELLVWHMDHHGPPDANFITEPCISVSLEDEIMCPACEHGFANRAHYNRQDKRRSWAGAAGIYFQCPGCSYIDANCSNMRLHKKICPQLQNTSSTSLKTGKFSEEKVNGCVGQLLTEGANSRNRKRPVRPLENSKTRFVIMKSGDSQSTSEKLSNGLGLSVSLKELPKNVLSVKNRFVCNQCKECFADEKVLSCHLVTHTQKKNFVCNKCKAEFSTGSTFIAHLLWHSGDKSIGPDNSNKPSEKEKCDLLLKRNNVEKPIVRQKTKKLFPLRKNSETNKCIQTENNPMICPECKKRFSSKWTLKTHLMLHKGEKHHVCPECNTRFVSPISLKRHLVTHTEEKPHVCPNCKKGFNFPWNLKTHIKIHRANNNICPKCKKSFLRKDSLRVHLRVHSGEEAHVCTQCNKKFRFQASLRIHLLVHAEEKSFGCSQCKRRYRQKCNLERHVKSHHC